MLVVPSVGRAAMLELIVKAGLTLELFTNDVQPGSSDTTGTYTTPSGGGYASKKLAGKGWVVKNGVAIAPEQVFTFTGPIKPNLVFGYFVRLGNILMWAERSEQPFPVNLKGDTFIVVPTFTLAE